MTPLHDLGQGPDRGSAGLDAEAVVVREEEVERPPERGGVRSVEDRRAEVGAVELRLQRRAEGLVLDESEGDGEVFLAGRGDQLPEPDPPEHRRADPVVPEVSLSADGQLADVQAVGHDVAAAERVGVQGEGPLRHQGHVIAVREGADDLDRALPHEVPEVPDERQEVARRLSDWPTNTRRSTALREAGRAPA